MAAERLLSSAFDCPPGSCYPVYMVYEADIPNLRQELDWLIHVRTCEWCGRTMAAPIPKEWRCLEDKEKRTKHWRNWRVCLSCGSSPFSVGFVYAPYIPLTVTDIVYFDLRELMAVQPMATPDPRRHHILHGHRIH